VVVSPGEIVDGAEAGKGRAIEQHSVGQVTHQDFELLAAEERAASQRDPSLTEAPAPLGREAGLELDSVELEPDALDDAGMIDYFMQREAEGT
jgi:hypothetical protein